MATGKNEHAQALARLGAAKGGAVRAMRTDRLTRSEIARNAAESRWGTAVPVATHSGELIIAGRKIVCAVLENGKRLLTQASFLGAIGRVARPKGGTGTVRLIGGDGLPPFLAVDNLQPFISDELRRSAAPIEFRSPRGGRGYGYDAMLLPMVCEVYLQANDEKALTRHQEHIAAACNLLMRGLARVGIIALVDEATGYQEQRAKDELHRILEAYISPELMPWTRMFPDDFFKHIYRLHGWAYKPGSAKRTPHVGKLINRYVYEQLPPGVLPELRRLNPVTARGYRRYKHFQFLTADTGNPHLDRQITAVTTIMRISDDRQEFERNFEKAFGKTVQERLPLIIEVEPSEAERVPLRLRKSGPPDPNEQPPLF